MGADVVLSQGQGSRDEGRGKELSPSALSPRPSALRSQLLPSSLVPSPSALQRQNHIRPHHRADPGFLCSGEEARRSVDPVRVDEGHDRQVFLCRVMDQVFRQRGAVEKRESGGGAQLRVRAPSARSWTARSRFRFLAFVRPAPLLMNVGDVIMLPRQRHAARALLDLLLLRAGRVVRDGERVEIARGFASASQGTTIVRTVPRGCKESTRGGGGGGMAFRGSPSRSPISATGSVLRNAQIRR